MGADIHLWVEKQACGSWEFANTYRIDPTGAESWVEWDEPYSDRNYWLFALLADVRNAATQFKPILPVRGVPADLSEIGKRIVEQWDGDGHSHSWASSNELLLHPWHDLLTIHGFVKADEADLWRTHRRPPVNWSQQPYSSYTEPLSWTDTKASLCGSFVDEFLPTLPSYGHPEETRVVFFFDN
jgi:hypothetical protein